MRLALDEARAAAARDEVPIGAVVVGPDGRVLSRAGNRVEEHCDPSAHAELLTMRAAGAALNSPRLTGCTLYVTLEPCPMCAAAIVHFRPARVVFGAYDPKGGGVEHGPRLFERPECLHRPEVIGGVAEREAADLLRAFFAARRPPRTRPAPTDPPA
ncbi:nucleoside deaminase [Ameyamaea chiangmaiensis]|uniref:tRNA-specific adenosine deaminase n=2 Tax=Ameyamaea chiangmaiensis TaxID=442969 RepID=A0A850P9G2_9PROT|nr:nucleoside deaminase [Ameyamaea chiangmaiensis]NVN41245.1 nucleoside deaminase [Ameyamaea chiangmaiensis]